MGMMTPNWCDIFHGAQFTMPISYSVHVLQRIGKLQRRAAWKRKVIILSYLYSIIYGQILCLSFSALIWESLAIIVLRNFFQSLPKAFLLLSIFLFYKSTWEASNLNYQLNCRKFALRCVVGEHVFNLSTLEPEAGESLEVQGQSSLHREILSLNN